jgi:ABC-type glycerol-3-phosphate transport system permease component
MKRLALHGAAAAIALVFLYPYLWMAASSFRSAAEVLRAPLRLWPERLDGAGYAAVLRVGDLSLLRGLANSLAITGASTAIA